VRSTYQRVVCADRPRESFTLIKPGAASVYRKKFQEAREVLAQLSPCHSQKLVAQVFGLSHQRIEQIELSALAKVIDRLKGKK